MTTVQSKNSDFQKKKKYGIIKLASRMPVL